MLHSYRSSLSSFCFFFFFFQAEDGIRDYKVTGVQTCALPISGTGSACSTTRRVRRRRGRSLGASCSSSTRASARPRSSRSEERRVGKECRSRGAPYHLKKKKKKKRGDIDRREKKKM